MANISGKGMAEPYDFLERRAKFEEEFNSKNYSFTRKYSKGSRVMFKTTEVPFLKYGKIKELATLKIDGHLRTVLYRAKMKSESDIYINPRNVTSIKEQ